VLLFLGKQRVAIFFGHTDVIRAACSQATTIFVDATFQTAPSDSNTQRSIQVLNFIAEINGIRVAFLHIIMSCKFLRLYEKVFERIKSYFPSLRPDTIIADYEPGLRKALRHNFPDARLSGCYSTVSKDIFAFFVNNCSLENYYKCKGGDKAVLGFLWRQLMSIPLLRAEDIKTEIKRIKCELKKLKLDTDIMMRVKKAFTYFINNWMKKYGPYQISVFGLSSRTTNCVERLHANMNKGPVHPSFFAFLDVLISK
jgi:hypothetical protein